MEVRSALSHSSSSFTVTNKHMLIPRRDMQQGLISCVNDLGFGINYVDVFPSWTNKVLMYLNGDIALTRRLRHGI